MKPTWSRAGIHPAARLARFARGLNRQRRAVGLALEAMRAGATLHLQYEPSREWWILSNGWTVPPDVAAIVINHPGVAAVGDTLFPNTRSQTWRFIEPKEETR